MEACNFIQNEIPPQIFSWILRKNFNNSFLTEHFLVNASEGGWGYRNYI